MKPHDFMAHVQCHFNSLCTDVLAKLNAGEEGTHRQENLMRRRKVNRTILLQ